VWDTAAGMHRAVLLGLVSWLHAGPVQDLGLLDSACHRPQAGLLGNEAYPTLVAKASALMHSLAGNRALVDGNKRLANSTWPESRSGCARYPVTE